MRLSSQALLAKTLVICACASTNSSSSVDPRLETESEVARSSNEANFQGSAEKKRISVKSNGIQDDDEKRLERSKVFADAIVGVEDPVLQGLLRDHWSDGLERSPIMATQLGVHLYDDRMPNIRLQAEQAEQRFLNVLHQKAIAIDPNTLSDGDRVNLRLFLEELDSNMATEVCQFSSWKFSARSNVVTTINRLAKVHEVHSIVDARNLVARYSQIPSYIETTISNIRNGMHAGLVGNQNSIKRVIEMVRKQMDEPFEQLALLEPARMSRPSWNQEQLSQFRDDLNLRVRQEIQPALDRYLRFLEQEVVAKGRDDNHVGLSALKGGDACYQALIQTYTTTQQTAAEIHQIGKQEVKRINDEMIRLSKKLFGIRKLKQLFKRLREDPALYFGDEKSVESFAAESLAEAQSKMARYFGRLPQAECVVSRIPSYKAPFSTIAYYQPPRPDGSKPGQYFINVYEPKTRPRYEARVLAFHESVPGHHLQIAIAQELPEVPAFRRFGGRTVFVEGWALYSERLADEMGLYRDDLDRMGVLSFDAWRAARLVVDTGIHAFSWSRNRAVHYLQDHTALALNNIENEVDRYINTPGQALAYKIGQLEILRLRSKAEQDLGDRFDVRAFHDAVLGAGAVSIAVLRDQVEAYIQKNRSGG